MRCFICTNSDELYIFVNDHNEVFSLCLECSEIADALKKHKSETVIEAIASYISDKHKKGGEQG